MGITRNKSGQGGQCASLQAFPCKPPGGRPPAKRLLQWTPCYAPPTQDLHHKSPANRRGAGIGRIGCTGTGLFHSFIFKLVRRGLLACLLATLLILTDRPFSFLVRGLFFPSGPFSLIDVTSCFAACVVFLFFLLSSFFFILFSSISFNDVTLSCAQSRTTYCWALVRLYSCILSSCKPMESRWRGIQKRNTMQAVKLPDRFHSCIRRARATEPNPGRPATQTIYKEAQKWEEKHQLRTP